MESNSRFQRIIRWLTLISVTLFMGMFLWGAVLNIIYGADWLMKIARDHFAATIGLPFAAIASLGLVLFLQISSGPVEFEGLSFKFKGASGQLILWVFCFMAITGSIKLLW